MKPAIRVQNLSKMYRIGQHQQGYDTLRESIMTALAAPFRLLKNARTPQPASTGKTRLEGDAYWALKEVAFDIEPGEVVGIIGRNGAGKSTLLKVLSNITEPTTGRIEIRGRVGSLLEVGTGFHSELSGRENIYMNGSILGMSQREIKSKFDEIVAFAEVENFLDTPVKRYSSGMYVRLAFAVAAHLEPEILIIDEVLAVGDAAFQRKCMQKMEDVAQHGRTVLFVSHNMAMVQRFCKQGIVLCDGRVSFQGDINTSARHYMETVEQRAICDIRTRTDRRGSQAAKLLAVVANTENESAPNVLISGQSAVFTFLVSQWRRESALVFTVYDPSGAPMVNMDTRSAVHLELPQGEDVEIRCVIEMLGLRPGRYRINTALFHSSECVDHLEAAMFFDVEGTICGNIAVNAGQSHGHVFLPHGWC